jgi:hypothetical protein
MQPAEGLVQGALLRQRGHAVECRTARENRHTDIAKGSRGEAERRG